jgi:hypothetical protein
MLVPQWPNDRWSLDFAADQFIDGRPPCTRECLALVPDTSISGIRVARELDRLMAPSSVSLNPPYESGGKADRGQIISRQPVVTS